LYRELQDAISDNTKLDHDLTVVNRKVHSPYSTFNFSHKHADARAAHMSILYCCLRTTDTL
jgi:hypothetical protein